MMEFESLLSVGSGHNGLNAQAVAVLKEFLGGAACIHRGTCMVGGYREDCKGILCNSVSDSSAQQYGIPTSGPVGRRTATRSLRPRRTFGLDEGRRKFATAWRSCAWVRGRRHRLVERIAGWAVEGKHARRESNRGRLSMAWASCSPRERPLAGGERVARKRKGILMSGRGGQPRGG